MKQSEQVLHYFNQFDGTRHVRATTALQDAFFAAKFAKAADRETAFGKLFVLCSDAFKQRNGFFNHLKKALIYIRELEAEVNHYRHESGEALLEPYIDPDVQITNDHKSIITKV